MSKKHKVFYKTKFGQAYAGDSLELMKDVDESSIDLIITSPPFALIKKKDYGNVPADKYVEWFLPFAKEMKRIIKPSGSVVIDLGGSWEKGKPTKSLYQWRLLISLIDEVGFHLAQEFYWHNSAKLPTPAEWVTIQRIRVKDAVNNIFWLSKTPRPKANNRNILKPYSKSMLRLIENGYKANSRPSGHEISTKFQKDNNGAIPPNMIEMGNTESNSWYMKACKSAGIKPHSARFPGGIPELFIRFLTDEGDIVLDPFAGSNVTGEIAQKNRRNWISIEIDKEFLEGSKLRFKELPETKKIIRKIKKKKSNEKANLNTP